MYLHRETVERKWKRRPRAWKATQLRDARPSERVGWPGNGNAPVPVAQSAYSVVKREKRR